MNRVGQIFTYIFVGIIFLSILGPLLEGLEIACTGLPADYAHITKVDYKSVVIDEPGSNGKIRVTERLTFDVRAASLSNRFWELWRDLPEEYVDGVKVEYNVLSVKQVFDDGRDPVIFTEAPQLYWYDRDFRNTEEGLGPGKWFHSEGPFDDYRNFECLIFYVNGLYRERVIFEIEYEMYNAALRFGDCSELFLTLYSGETIKFLTSYKGQILLPEDIMPRPGNFEVTTYGTNARGFPVTQSTTINPGYHTFLIELDRSDLNFRLYNRYLEFALLAFGEDKHIFTQYASVNDYFHDETVLGWIRNERAAYERLHTAFIIVRIIVFLIFIALALLTIMLIKNTDKRLRKKHRFFAPESQIHFFRDIPGELDPNFAAKLVFCKDKSFDVYKHGFAAVMLDLVRKGYIELSKINPALDWVPGNTLITVKHRPVTSNSFCTSCGFPVIAGSNFCSKCAYPVGVNAPAHQLKPLSQTEEHYFNLIYKHSDARDAFGTRNITMFMFQKRIKTDYENTDTFVAAVKKAVEAIGMTVPRYFQKADFRERKRTLKAQAKALYVFGVLTAVILSLIFYQTRIGLAYGGFFILGATLFACGIYLSAIAKRYILFTQHGTNEYAKWRGLYTFLNSETLMHERTVVDLVIWEQYLVYATAFGISHKVVKALEIRCPQVLYGAGSSPVFRSNYYRSRSFYRSSSSFNSATRSASFSAASRGGGSGGSGGFGGGRGGGGGGGGH